MKRELMDEVTKFFEIEILKDMDEEIKSEIVYTNRRDSRNVEALKNFSTLWDCFSSASPSLAKNLGNPLLQNIDIESIPDLPAKTLSALKETDEVFKQEDIEEKGSKKTVVEMQRAISRLLVHLDSEKGK